MIMFSGSFGIDLGWEDSYNDYDSEKMKKLKEKPRIQRKVYKFLRLWMVQNSTAEQTVLVERNSW